MTSRGGTLLVEDDRRTSELLRSILGRHGLSPIEIADTATLAEARIRASAPDLVFLDLGLPDGDGVDLIRVVRRASYCQPILVLTSTVSDQEILRALRAGADGYLFKEDLAARLPTVLRDLRDGGVPLSPRAANVLLQAVRLDRNGLIPPAITPREASVLEFLATGGGYSEIARELKIGLNTVRTHVRSLYDKLGVENRAEAVNIAWNLGLLQRSA